jgi:drug/metabolite transporter (DMT)-like permease
MNNFRYFFLIFILLVLWSSSYVSIRYSLEKLTATNLAFLRYLFASIGFLLVVLIKKIKLPLFKDLPMFIILGITGFTLYNLLLNTGEITVNAGIASFIINTVPFFTLIITLIQGQEKVTTKDILGLIIAFFGVFIIIFTTNNNANLDINTLYILGAAICQALYFALQKRMLIRYTPIEITSYSVWIGTIILFLFSDKAFQALGSIGIPHLLNIIYLGVFPGMLAYIIVAYALQKDKASNVSSYLFLIPFITLFIAWVLLGEIPTVWAITGGIFIIIGIILKNNVISLRRQSEVK